MPFVVGLGYVTKFQRQFAFAFILNVYKYLTGFFRFDIITGGG